MKCKACEGSGKIAVPRKKSKDIIYTAYCPREERWYTWVNRSKRFYERLRYLCKMEGLVNLHRK